MKTWEKVGYVGVDAGLIWISDPCYVIGDDSIASTKWEKWSDFCKELDENNVHIFDEGIAVQSGYGDGSYPVYVIRVDGRIKEVKVKFF